MLPLLWLAERGELATLTADHTLPPPDDRFAAWAAVRNREAGFAYRFRGLISHPDMPIYLGDGELAEAVRQARDAITTQTSTATPPYSRDHVMRDDERAGRRVG